MGDLGVYCYLIWNASEGFDLAVSTGAGDVFQNREKDLRTTVTGAHK